MCRTLTGPLACGAMAKTPDKQSVPVHGSILGIGGSLMVFFGFLITANAGRSSNTMMGPMIFQAGMMFIAAALVVGALRRR